MRIHVCMYACRDLGSQPTKQKQMEGGPDTANCQRIDWRSFHSFYSAMQEVANLPCSKRQMQERAQLKPDLSHYDWGFLVACRANFACQATARNRRTRRTSHLCLSNGKGTLYHDSAVLRLMGSLWFFIYMIALSSKLHHMPWFEPIYPGLLGGYCRQFSQRAVERISRSRVEAFITPPRTFCFAVHTAAFQPVH